MVNTSSDRKKKNLKGVVLIMVVTVMMVLIVMLLATLAAVSSAQNRYYSKYEENQAYYSARSAIEVCLGSQFIDSNYFACDTGGAVRQYSYIDQKTGNLESADMTQGLGIQLDLYRVKAHADTLENYEAMTDKTQFSEDFWANPGANGETVFNNASDPATGYFEAPDKNYVEYKVRFPQITDGSDSYGGFVDQTDRSDPTTQIAKIRIEVIARTFDGHDDKLNDKIAANPGNRTALIAADKASIKSGNRCKDKTYFKITAITECQGTEQSASIIYTGYEEEEGFKSAITATGFIGGIDNGVIIDGYATPEDVALGNMGVYVGQSYAGGDVTIPNGGATIPMGRGQCTYFKSISYVQNNFFPMSLGVTDSSGYGDVPVLFVDGDCTFSNQITWGNGSTSGRADQVDLVVNGDFTAGSDLNFNGNIIVSGNMNLGSNNINMSALSSIIVGGDLNITNGNILGGLGSVPIYVAGNVDLGGQSIARFPSTLFLREGSTVTAGEGEFEAKNTGMIGDVLGDYTSYQILTMDEDLSTGETPFSHLDITENQTEEGSEIYIPTVTVTGFTANIDNTKGIAQYARYAPCDTSKYESFWKRNPDGSYVMNGSDPVFITAEEYAGTPLKSDRDAGIYEEMSFDAPADAEPLPSFGGVYVTDSQDYVLTSGSLDLYIQGTGEANIYVQPGYYQGKIISEDDTFINFYFPSGNYTWNVANYTDSIEYGFRNGLRFGDDEGRIPPPNIGFYLSAGSELNCSQAGWCLLTGYIYGPDATINTVKGLDGYTYTYYYDGEVVVMGTGQVMNSSPIIIGAIFCNDLNVSQNSAICFIKQEPVYNPGDPFIKRTENEYYTSR